MGSTSLAHHIDLRWLYQAYLQPRRDGAVGVDGQTAEDYEASLLGNLQALLDRAKSGTYRAPPVRRVRPPPRTAPHTPPGWLPPYARKTLTPAAGLGVEDGH